MSWLEVLAPVPVLNTPDFSAVFANNALPLNENGHPFHFEFVALKGMRFLEIEKMSPTIAKIQWPQYSNSSLFIDLRFCKESQSPPSQTEIPFTPQFLLSHMEKRVGSSYVWGGNWAEGIPEMLRLYPPSTKLDPRMETLWTFRGLDCSGLLFEASGGMTPRNTSHLLRFGRSLDEGEPFQPLDMIIYPGHVLFVQGPQTIIESKSPFGVRICPLDQRWEEISAEKLHVREWTSAIDPQRHFTVRRFV